MSKLATRPASAGLSAALLATMPLAATGCRRAETPRPNVVLVSIDTLRPDHLGCYGYARETSPNIDRLASQGVLFETAISPTAWTLPGHASMLTGLTPRRHGATEGARAISPEAPLLSEILKRQGYAAQAIVNAPFLAARLGFGRGFDSYVQVPKQEWRRHHQLVMDAVRARPKQPFFLFVHYMSVHTPYEPPPEFDVFRRPYAGPLTGAQREVRDIVEGRIRLDQAGRDFLVDRYDGGILAVDHRIGELLAALEDGPPTVFVLTSDHGEEFLDHGSVWHSKTLYEDLIRVPLIMRGPGVPAGVRVKTLATLMDVVPTVLDLVRLPVPARLDGYSLRPFWRDDRQPDRVVELWTSYPKGDRGRRGLRTPRYKLIRDEETGKVSFFDLHADPGERRDLYPTPQARALERLLAAAGEAASGAPAEMSPEDLEALKALGYVS